MKKSIRKLNNDTVILIAGSSGALESVIAILENLPEKFGFPVIIVLHRLKNAFSTLEDVLQVKSSYTVKEALEKELIKKNTIYVAPADYHLILEMDKSFSLDASEPVNFSRPSIDVSFESFSVVLRENLCGILLSGSNHDGAKGLRAIAVNGGTTIVQAPSDCRSPQMPLAALELYNDHHILTLKEISDYINSNAK